MKVIIEYTAITYCGENTTFRITHEIDECEEFDILSNIDEIDKLYIIDEYGLSCIIDYKHITPMVIFLNGQHGYDDEDIKEDFEENGYKVHLIDDLYENPQKLRILKAINPEYIYIRSTGTFYNRSETLKDEFRKLKWIPKNILFHDHWSISLYKDLAKALQSKGTKMYFIKFLVELGFDKVKCL